MGYIFLNEEERKKRRRACNNEVKRIYQGLKKNLNLSEQWKLVYNDDYIIINNNKVKKGVNQDILRFIVFQMHYNSVGNRGELADESDVPDVFDIEFRDWRFDIIDPEVFGYEEGEYYEPSVRMKTDELFEFINGEIQKWSEPFSLLE